MFLILTIDPSRTASNKFYFIQIPNQITYIFTQHYTRSLPGCHQYPFLLLLLFFVKQITPWFRGFLVEIQHQ